jgi:hypothetical protein
MVAALSSEELMAAWAGPGAAADPAFETCLREYLSAARSVWPELGIDDAEFVRYVAARTSQQLLPPSEHAADVLLACACSRGLGPAVMAFQRVYGPVIDRVLMHRRAATHLADDARQIVQERLLVGDVGGAPPQDRPVPRRGSTPELGRHGRGPYRADALPLGKPAA